jgi:putative MFS transporter
MQHSNAANRLDRLPISRFHKVMLVALSFAYFFEFADINSFATTAPKLIKLWGLTVNQIAYVTSLSLSGCSSARWSPAGSPTAGAARPPCR